MIEIRRRTTGLHVPARPVLYAFYQPMVRVLKSPKTSIALVLLVLDMPGAAWAQTSSSGATGAQTAEIPNPTTQPVLLEADQTTIVTRDTSLNIANNLFSLDDCLRDRTLRYQLSVTNTEVTVPLQTWVSQGSECTPAETRGAPNFRCWLGSPAPVPNSPVSTTFIRIQDIAHQNIGAARPADYVRGTAEDCVGQNSVPFNIQFIFIRGTQSVGTPATATVTLDTVGPNPPRNVQSGVGERLVNIRWDLPAATTDVAAYNVYCDDGNLEALPDGGATVPDSGVADGTGDAAVDVDASEGLMPLQNGTSSGSTNDATSSSSSASGGSRARPGTSTDCPATTSLRAGQLPSPNWQICGKGTGGTSNGVTVSRLGLSDSSAELVNDTRYAFAVSAVDTIGNPGPLSEVICNTPVSTQDFFDAYKAAGGQAGGCSAAGDGVASAVPASAFGLLGLALVRGLQQRRKRTNSQAR